MLLLRRICHLTCACCSTDCYGHQHCDDDGHTSNSDGKPDADYRNWHHHPDLYPDPHAHYNDYPDHVADALSAFNSNPFTYSYALTHANVHTDLHAHIDLYSDGNHNAFTHPNVHAYAYINPNFNTYAIPNSFWPITYDRYSPIPEIAYFGFGSFRL
jgi:hypothetical protein